MPNLAALSQFSSRAQALSNLIVVAPTATGSYQPQNPPVDGVQFADLALPPKLLFHYEGEQSLMLESDITDHFVEDNTALQDQIANKPERIFVKGFIGELNDVPPFAPEVFKFIQDKLTVIAPFTPQLTQTGLVAYNTAFGAYQAGAAVATAGVSAWSAINDVTGANDSLTPGLSETIEQLNRNKQQVMFQTLYGYWRRRVLFTVQTPWAMFQDMAIQSLRPVQDADTRMISDFEITFKRIRIASTIVEEPLILGRATAQSAALQDNGTNRTNPTETSFDGEFDRMEATA